MSEFLKSDPALDRAIAECNDPEQIREITKKHLESAGLISRERGADFGMRVTGALPSEPVCNVPLSANGFKYEKEIRFAESTGKRALVIRANTLEDLKALEKQIVGE